MGEGQLVYLGLGANLGDRESQIRVALTTLDQLPGVSVEAVSSLRETEPVGGPAQGPYLNGAARLRCCLPAPALFAVLKQLERDAGRDLSAPRNHPRPLDLDILLFGRERIESATLEVPHPRMWERAFVLEPLAELEAELPARPQIQESIADSEELVSRCRRWVGDGLSVGLVLTMGALHAGHRALIEQARAENDRVVVTIFVNPLQFGPGEDFERYPRTLEEDQSLLQELGVDLVFAPAADSVFPLGFASEVAVGAEAESMEGAVRPGHFVGVVTVVARLWQLVQPTRSYFGQKDAQQVAVIRRLQKDLALSGVLVECPTVREPDGLALSSRNRYLSSEDRKQAPRLYRAMQRARIAFAEGERRVATLLGLAREELSASPEIAVDYLELRREPDLSRLGEQVDSSVRMLIAARFGESPTRLIDNLKMGPV